MADKRKKASAGVRVKPAEYAKRVRGYAAAAKARGQDAKSRALASHALGVEMRIASRVAKGQATRAAKETVAMATIPDRLKGLKKAQLAQIAREVGVSVNSRTTAKQLRSDIAKRTVEHARFDAKNAVAKQSNPWGRDPLNLGFDQSKVKAAAAKGRAAMEAKINAAIDKVAAATAPAKRLPALPPPPVAPLSRAADKYPAKPPRTPKTNPALVQALADKVSAALRSGDAAKLNATLADVNQAKLSKADSHALAKKSLGFELAPSASGKKARGAVARRLERLSNAVSKMKAVGGRSAGALGPVVMPALAVGAAAIAFSDSASAGEGRVVAVKKGVKAAADVVTAGAVSAYDKAKARGAGEVEAVAAGAVKGAINIATFGVAEAANDMYASQGGFPAAMVETFKAAATKLLGSGEPVAKQSPQGKAYLNDAAARKAATPSHPVAPVAMVAAASAQRSDGRTDSYTRRGPSGQMVQVKGYRTPERRR